MAEDWRVKVTFPDVDAGGRLVQRIEEWGRRLLEARDASELELETLARLGDRVVISRDGPELFLYADTEDAARAVEGVVRSLLGEHGVEAPVALDRWHPEAEEWQPADEPLPRTPEEVEAERRRRLRREDEDTARGGYSQWEVRAELASHDAARALSEQLDADGVPHLRRWRYVLVGAVDEDAGRAIADRLRAVAPDATRVSVEGTFQDIMRENPYQTPAGNPFVVFGTVA